MLEGAKAGISGHTDRVTSITLSHNGQFFVTTSLDKSVRTWDLMQGTAIRNFSPHSERIICSLMTHDDLFVITGSADSSAKVVSLENGRIVRSFQDHTGPVCALAITSGSEFLITGNSSSSVNRFAKNWYFRFGRFCCNGLGLGDRAAGVANGRLNGAGDMHDYHEQRRLPRRLLRGRDFARLLALFRHGASRAFRSRRKGSHYDRCSGRLPVVRRMRRRQDLLLRRPQRRNTRCSPVLQR